MDDEELVYQCACGGAKFWLAKDGRVFCEDCELPFKDIEVIFPQGIPTAEAA